VKAPPLYAAVFVAISSTILPSAAADPPQFPNLSGYTDVNYKHHVTYSAYSTLGVQFVTPGSYRCRLSYISKAATSLRQCWGSLPADKDLSSMAHYQWMDGPGQWHDGAVTAAKNAGWTSP
jgi:hypothetical protein